jgi:xanthosine utilization system XapX-like protein
MTGGIIATAILAASPVPPFVAYLGLVPFAFGTYFLMTASVKSEAYQRAKTAYESQRHRLLTQLAAASPSSDAPENSR